MPRKIEQCRNDKNQALITIDMQSAAKPDRRNKEQQTKTQMQKAVDKDNQFVCFSLFSSQERAPAKIGNSQI
jgi:hypothetical protein